MAVDYSNWMKNTLPIIGGQPLKNVSMSASHDAGMSSVSNCGIGANACNTQTQTKTILGQLQSGTRYFDIRPVIYKGVMYTGHLDESTGIGCNGESLQSVLNDVSTFIARSGDLVLLKFSHYFDRDHGITGTSGFTSAQMTTLVNMVSSSLQRYLFSQPTKSGQGDLSGFTMNQYIGQRGVVLTVYDQLPSNLWNSRTGVYAYADKGGAGDLIVYDQYSKTNDLNTMVTDQLAKLENPGNHGINLFLLSWTLTLSASQAIACAATPQTTQIVNLAQSAKQVLQQNIQTAYYAKQITSTIMPNLLYTDACDSSITDTAIWLNQQLYGAN